MYTINTLIFLVIPGLQPDPLLSLGQEPVEARRTLPGLNMDNIIEQTGKEEQINV